jgi:hypothetical protein
MTLAAGLRWVRPGDVVTIDPADCAYSNGHSLTIGVISTTPDIATVADADWVRVAGVEVVDGVEVGSDRRALVRVSALTLPEEGLSWPFT